MNRVKEKATLKPQLLQRTPHGSSWKALGAVDLHFHGAFGVDLMTANERQLDQLARHLFRHGVAAFLPTTLSDRVIQIESALERLGQWVAKKQAQGPRTGEAFPLGIHLEGPFIAKSCCGAHPKENLLTPSLDLIEKWMALSQNTLARITLAPEIMPWMTFRRILKWAKGNEIAISLGHSDCDSNKAMKAFDLGANSITHAWNAMPFHHRTPGILGSALGRNNLFIELIPDDVHVSDTVTHWTLQLHPKGICWVSDAVPAAETQQTVSFGPLEVSVRQGAGRTPQGALAGGGYTLLHMIARFWGRRRLQSSMTPQSFEKRILQGLTDWPISSLPRSKRWLKPLLSTHAFEYHFGRKLTVRPLGFR